MRNHGVKKEIALEKVTSVDKPRIFAISIIYRLNAGNQKAARRKVKILMTNSTIDNQFSLNAF